jgi:hypothetical protein
LLGTQIFSSHLGDASAAARIHELRIFKGSHGRTDNKNNVGAKPDFDIKN